MIKSEIAIEKAVEYLKGVKPEYLGAMPESIRLETVQLFGKDWVVVLSYLTQVQQEGENLTNKLLQALSTRRYIKEFEIDAESGELIAMRNPEAPSTTGASLAA